MKKLLAAIMSLCIVGGAIPAVYSSAPECAITASAYTDNEGNEYEQVGNDGNIYYVYADHAEFINGDYNKTEMIIPSEINGVPVTKIGERSFSSRSYLTSITIPDSVTIIDERAFDDCENLKSITIGNSVTTIGYGAFWGCSNLESITIPDSVTSIGDNAFRNTSWLESKREENPLVIVNGILIDGVTCSGDVVIPDSVTSIGGEAFRDCSNLASITIPDTVTSIGQGAFSQCTSLKSIIIPDTVTSIDAFTFSGCESLEEITIPNSVESIFWGAFGGCTSLTSIVIPDSVTIIGAEIFSGCTSLESVTISDSVTEISDCMFWGCTSLESVTIPDSVTSIEGFAFKECSKLASISIPDSVTSVGQWAFYDCSRLETISIPDSVRSIGEYAFKGTKWLESKRKETPLVIVNGILIDGTACSGNVIISDSVTSICRGAFCECSSIESVTILNPDCEIYDDEKTISNGAIKNKWGYYDYYYEGTIRGYDNSTAQAYAEKYGYKFEALPDKALKKGDANGDGNVDMSDVVMVMQACLNPAKYGVNGTSEDRITADGAVLADCCDLIVSDIE